MDLSKLGGVGGMIKPAAGQVVKVLGSAPTMGYIFVSSLDITNKTLVFETTGRYALSLLAAGFGGGLPTDLGEVSVEIDGRLVLEDAGVYSAGVVGTASVFSTVTSGANSNNALAPILIEENIKIWMKRVGTSNGSLTLNLIKLEN